MRSWISAELGPPILLILDFKSVLFSEPKLLSPFRPFTSSFGSLFEPFWAGLRKFVQLIL